MKGLKPLKATFDPKFTQTTIFNIIFLKKKKFTIRYIKNKSCKNKIKQRTNKFPYFPFSYGRHRKVFKIIIFKIQRWFQIYILNGST